MSWLGSTEVLGGAAAIALGVFLIWALRKPAVVGDALPVAYVTLLPSFILFLIVVGAAIILHALGVL